jgi:hypothetical protein
VQITTVNAGLKIPPIGRTEVITWKSKDGKQIEDYYLSGRLSSWSACASDTEHSRRPLRRVSANVPRRQRRVSTRDFFFARLRDSACESAWFERLRNGLSTCKSEDWGFGDYQDLMTGVDRVIEMGVADPARLGVMGWSYGGFMTTWVVTQTNRFKAASAGAPVTNLMSFNGTSDIPAFIPDYFGGQFLGSDGSI